VFKPSNSYQGSITLTSVLSYREFEKDRDNSNIEATDAMFQNMPPPCKSVFKRLDRNRK